MSLFSLVVLLWRKKRPTYAWYLLLVLLAHGIALIAIACYTPKPPLVHKLCVKEKKSHPVKSAVSKSPLPKTSSSKKQQKTRPQTKPLPKKTTPIKSSPAKSKPPTSTKISPQIQDSLQKLEKSIAQIEAKHATIKAPSKEPSAFSKEDNKENEAAFVAILTTYLQEQLQLPDMGEVTVQLTFDSHGMIQSMNVLSSQSKHNQKRIEERLPALHLPLAPASSTWILTLYNEG